MVKQCFKCKKLNFLNPHLTFHGLPRNPLQRKAWISNLKLKQGFLGKTVPKSCVVCSDHFNQNDFEHNNRGKWVLKEDALPKSDNIDAELSTECKDGLMKDECKGATNEFEKMGSVTFNNLEVENEEIHIKKEDLEPGVTSYTRLSTECKDRLMEDESNGAINEQEQMAEDTLYNFEIKNEEIYIKNENLEPDITRSDYSGQNENPKITFSQEEYQMEQESSLKKSPQDPIGVEKFSCKECNYKSIRQSDVKRHLRTHKDPAKHGRFQCSHCIFKTNYRGLLRNHLLLHNNTEGVIHFEFDGVKKFSCDQCGFLTTRWTILKKHLQSHKYLEEIGRFKCLRCGVQTSSRSVFERHLQLHANPRIEKFPCTQCGYESFHRRDLYRHLRLHGHPKEFVDIFKCNCCNFQTMYKGRLRAHLLLHKYADEQIFKCTECSFRTRYTRAVHRHSARHKNPQKNHLFQCERCNYRTFNKGYFMRHSLLHKKSGVAAD